MNKKTKLKKIYLNFIRKIKIYFGYFKIKFLNEIQYKTAALAGISTQFAWGGMYIMLYTAFLNNGGTQSYTIPQLATFIWLQQGFFQLFNMWSTDKDILSQCETGEIAIELVKPIDLYDIWHAKTFGKKFAALLLRIIPIIVICSMPFFGEYRLQAPVSGTAFIAFAITIVLSTVLMLAYAMLEYIATMKTISSRGMLYVFQTVMEFSSGLLIPIAFMPDKLVKILKFTPFYYMQNASFNIYNGFISNTGEIIKIITLQVVWIIILTVLGRKMMRKQLSKVVVQGG